MTGASEIRELLKRYYDGVSKGGEWSHLLSENFLLTGTVPKESRGRDLYVNNSFFKMVKGLRVKELITEGDSGFAIISYDLVSPKGKPFSSEVAEFWKAKEGKLDSVAIYFDTAAFSSFLAQ
jgi:ketosteroid isomerase-like protein